MFERMLAYWIASAILIGCGIIFMLIGKYVEWAQAFILVGIAWAISTPIYVRLTSRQ